MRLGAAWFVALAAIAGFLLLASPQRGAFDFQAYYCSGYAVRERADPYTTHPLLDCETAQTRGTYAALPPAVALPAPLPGYDLAFFALLSFLPFAIAKAVWGAFLGAGVAIALIALYRLFTPPPAALFAAFAASLVLPSLGFGEPFALYAAALCASAYFAREKRWEAASLCAACTMLEPSLGLPVCAALFVLVRQTRVWLGGAAAVLALLSLAVLGVHANAEYFGTVLHLHALSEISSDAQLTLGAVLFAAGVPAGIALAVNGAFSVAVAIIAIAAGANLAKRYDDRALLPLAAAAFSLAGSTFVHVSAYFAALPLALAMVRYARKKALALVAVCLASVPWMDAVQQGSTIAAIVLGALVIFVVLWSETRDVGRAVVAAAAAAIVLYAVPNWYRRDVRVAPPALRMAPLDPHYAQMPWQRYNAARLSSETAPSWILRGASWSALAALALSAI